MIKVFTLNENGKIELTKEELEKLLIDAYYDGYRSKSNNTIIYSPPYSPPVNYPCWVYNPYEFTCVDKQITICDLICATDMEVK